MFLQGEDQHRESYQQPSLWSPSEQHVGVPYGDEQYVEEQYDNYTGPAPGPMTSLLMGERGDPYSFSRDDLFSDSGYQALRMSPSKYFSAPSNVQNLMHGLIRP